MEDYDDFFEEVPEIIRDHKTGIDYSRGEFLGSGAFGKVNWDTDIIYQEISIQMSLRHPNILRLFRYFYCPFYVCMTLELCKETLSDVLKRLKVLDEASCKFVVREVARGLSHLHDNRIIHRDIKPDNIFLTNDMDVKIGDFGIAIRHENPAKKVTEACGTILYLAPESLDGSGYSFGIDVWALGVTLYKMAVGHHPFRNRVDFLLYNKIMSCSYIVPSTIPVHTGDMIRSLLTRDPGSRPTINEVLKCDYLNSKSISKDHLRGYDLRERYVMPLLINVNIPKKDCKLNPNRGIEDIFQKRFSFVVIHRFREYTWMTFKYDNSHENENIPEKEFKLDIEKKSSFILEKTGELVNSIFRNVPKRIPSSEMDRIGLSSFSRPKHFVSRWIDFNEKYGLGYQLSDSSVGVLFKDNSRLVVDRTMKNYQYINKNGAREYFNHDKCPTMLGKRFKLLEYFKNYMETYLQAEQPSEEQEGIKVVDKGIPILLKWKRNDKCICFLLLNGVLQVNFLEEHTKVIISVPTKSISIINQDKKLKTYDVTNLSVHGWDEFMEEKMSYIKKIVEEWTSLKRKHGGDGDIVPAKRSNNNNR
uniref:polo kinase n=1 Tax=Strongyloides papillosus TaxID=174720 RepID=A0A0N5BIY5_STREA